MAWQKGQSGNPGGKPKRAKTDPVRAFTLRQTLYELEERQRQVDPHYRDIDPLLLQQPREKQAEDLRQGAYHLAKRCELKLHRDLDIDAKNLWDTVRAWGTAADKILQVAESEGLSLFVPSALLDKLMLAVTIKRTDPTPPPVVVTPQLPLGDDTQTTQK